MKIELRRCWPLQRLVAQPGSMEIVRVAPYIKYSCLRWMMDHSGYSLHFLTDSCVTFSSSLQETDGLFKQKDNMPPWYSVSINSSMPQHAVLAVRMTSAIWILMQPSQASFRKQDTAPGGRLLVDRSNFANRETPVLEPVAGPELHGKGQAPPCGYDDTVHRNAPELHCEEAHAAAAGPGTDPWEVP